MICIDLALGYDGVNAGAENISFLENKKSSEVCFADIQKTPETHFADFSTHLFRFQDCSKAGN